MTIFNIDTIKKYHSDYLLVLFSTYLLNCKPNADKSPISKLFNVSPDIVKNNTGRTLLLQYADFMYAGTTNEDIANYTKIRHIILMLDFIYHTFPKEEWPEHIYKLVLGIAPNINAFKLSTLDYSYIFKVLFNAKFKRNFGIFTFKGKTYNFTKTRIKIEKDSYSINTFILTMI